MSGRPRPKKRSGGYSGRRGSRREGVRETAVQSRKPDSGSVMAASVARSVPGRCPWPEGMDSGASAGARTAFRPVIQIVRREPSRGDLAEGFMEPGSPAGYRAAPRTQPGGAQGGFLGGSRIPPVPKGRAFSAFQRFLPKGLLRPERRGGVRRALAGRLAFRRGAGWKRWFRSRRRIVARTAVPMTLLLSWFFS